MHARIRQDCFILPAPPNFFISLQVRHSPQSSRLQFSHCPHRVRRRLIPGPTFVPSIGPLGPVFLAIGFFCNRKQEHCRILFYFKCTVLQFSSEQISGNKERASGIKGYTEFVGDCYWKPSTQSSL